MNGVIGMIAWEADRAVAYDETAFVCCMTYVERVGIDDYRLPEEWG